MVFPMSTGWWRACCALATVVLYGVSISGEAYDATTPLDMPHHILLRKIYAMGAFTLLGFLFERSRFGRARGVAAAAIAIGLYSYLIELGQIYIDQAFETFAEHGFDVASGVVGGALGALVMLLFTAPRDPRRRVEIGIVVVLLALLSWFYFGTYALRDH